MAYGSEVWYDPDDARVGRNKLIYPLQVIQNKCLRTITGAYKTTNIQILEHEASIEPLDLHLERLAMTHRRRLQHYTCARVARNEHATGEAAKQSRAVA